MRRCKHNPDLRRYHHLPMDAVLALLYDSRDEEDLLAGRSRRRRPIP